MTDKIIDGIDVSKCSNYDQDSFFECENSYCHCDEISNCYFKQLKRKEQEYERLKRDYFKQNKWLQEQKQEYENYKIANAELEKENDELLSEDK